MSKLEIFTTNPIEITINSFYPRNYNPQFKFVKNGMINFPNLSNYITGEIKGGSTPPAHLFCKKGGVPFIKTSAVARHYININDLYRINVEFHKKK